MAGIANAGLYPSGAWSKAGTGADQTVATATDTRVLRVGTIVVYGTATDILTISDGTTQKLAVPVGATGVTVIPWNGSFLTSIVVKAATTTTVSLTWN